MRMFGLNLTKINLIICLNKTILIAVLTICEVCSFPDFSSAQIQHIEPLNWWVGMKNPHLQLMVHGNNIAQTTPEINYPGVTIQQVHKGEKNNYLFIDLFIDSTTKPGNCLIQFIQNKKELYTCNYPICARTNNPELIKGFDASDVIYLIVPDRFSNGDSLNDVILEMREKKMDRTNEEARHGGDIKGIINHLDYIKNMGFTAIWTTPMLENNMEFTSYHGYATTDYYKVDPRLGTLSEYKQLATKAKEKGLKLIFDGVVNHIGKHHWWMNELPFHNWINKPDSFVTSNHRRTTNQDPYASKYDNDLMIHGWFDKAMPDLNVQHEMLANYLIQQTLWWIETLQLGGIRQDTYCYSDKNFLQKWSCAIMNEYPNFNIVGEEWSLNPLTIAYWQKGNYNKDGYKSCLKTVMDFPLQNALIQALKEPEDAGYDKGLSRLYEALSNDFAFPDPNSILVMVDNHDMNRVLTQLKGDISLTKMALTYLLTIRGIPQILYGTELLYNNGPEKNDGLIRADFLGGWEDDAISAFSGIGLSADQLNMQQYLKKLLNWRKVNPVIHKGKTLHFAPSSGVYVYFRYNQEKTVMVVLNKNNRPVKIDLNKFSEILKHKSTLFNPLTVEYINTQNELLVLEKTAMIYEIY